LKSLIAALLISSLLMLISGTVDASTLASGEKLEVKVDPKKVGEETAALWQRFGAWCAIAEWHPAVKKCEETREGDAVFRTLTLGNGVKIKEKLIDKTPTSYRYAIVESPLPVKNFEAQFSVTPDDDAVNIVWSATYDAADGKTDKDARSLVDGSFKHALTSIKAKLGDKAARKPVILDCARYMPTAGITVAAPCDQ
jgi:hypothetical protein